MLTNKKEMVTDVNFRDSLGCSYHEMVELRILRGGNRIKNRTTTLDFRISLQRSAWKIPVGYGLGEKRGLGEMVDIQGSSPPGSRKVYTNVQEIKER